LTGNGNAGCAIPRSSTEEYRVDRSPIGSKAAMCGATGMLAGA
jgi:hypothetical protein